MIKGRKQFIITMLNIVILLICMAYMCLSWEKPITYNGWAIELSIVSIFLLIYQLIIMRTIKSGLYSFIFWFTIINYVFIFGRIYLKAIGLENQLGWNLFARYPTTDAYHAALFCVNYIQGIFTGMVAFTTSKKNIIYVNKQNHANLFYIGCILLVLTMPFRLYCDLVQIMTQRISGEYVAIAEINGVVSSIGQLFPLSIIYLISSTHTSEKKSGLFFLSYCTYSLVIMMLSGDRRYAFIGIIASTLCYLRKKKTRINLKICIMFLVVAFLGLSLLTAIRRERETGVANFGIIIDVMISSFTKDNIVYELFNEFGLTFYTYMLAFKNIPSVIGYKYGASFIFGFLGVIPGAYRYAYDVIMQNNIYKSIYNIEHQGLGGAFGQELYGNFGLIAPIFAIFAGYLLVKLMGNERDTDECALARYYSLFYIFLNLVRASFSEICRVLVYYFVIVWFIDLVIKTFQKHKSISRL